MHAPETTWATRVAEVAGILRTSMVGGEIGAADSTDGGKYSSAPHQLIVGYRRLFPARMLGLVLALAGTGAAGYVPTDVKGDTLLSVAVGLLVQAVLMLSAFYMALRFLKFAASG